MNLVVTKGCGKRLSAQGREALLGRGGRGRGRSTFTVLLQSGRECDTLACPVIPFGISFNILGVIKLTN